MQRYADSRFTGAFRPNVGELAAGRNSPHREDLGGPFHLTSQYRGTCGGGRAWRRKPGQAVRHESRYFAARGARAYPFSLERIDQLFDEIDVLLCPVSSITAPPQTHDETIIAIFENDHRNIIRLTRLTSFWDLAATPAIALPWGFDRDGLPLAVQLVTRVGTDEALLSIAARLEVEAPDRGRRPALE